MDIKCDLLLIDIVTESHRNGKRFDNMTLGCLAAYAREKGFKAEIVELRDYNSERKLRKLIHNMRPKLIGFTAYTNWINYVSKLGRMIKGFSNDCAWRAPCILPFKAIHGQKPLG